ncbi:zinc finger protein 572-like [Anopheles nili]|uniref:zinc finger protein 572-like n=1 Tax=Anopheles nili TaxID=185578 RepID=UPI00237A1AB2|nr:zinc finger protein 572-like [Anopheles nili]
MPHASELCDSPDIKNSYPLHTIANSSENGESSSMQRFPSRSGMELEKRYDHEERLESFLKYKYESESEEDDPLEMEKSHNRQTNTIARRSKYKPRKRYGHRDPDIFSSKMQLESDVRKYPCPECPLSFKTGYHLKRHHATIHQDQRFPCNVCQTSYGRREKLRAHMELVHQIQSYFVCDICLVSYESSDLLQRHVYRHQHPKPLECGTCFTPSVRLADESYSSNHICITYQDSYECCGKDFGFHYYYNRHMLTAHNIKTNARVKLPKGTLLSQFRALRSAKV